MMEILKISLIAYMFCALGQKGMIFEWYQDLINQLPEWLCRPLGGCHLCFTGQFCLWYYLFTKPFDLIELLFFVSSGIFMSAVYNKIYCFLRND